LLKYSDHDRLHPARYNGVPFSDPELVSEIQQLLETYTVAFGYDNKPPVAFTSSTLAASPVNVSSTASTQHMETRLGALSLAGGKCFFADNAKVLKPENAGSAAPGPPPAFVYGLRGGGGILLREIIELLSGTVTGNILCAPVLGRPADAAFCCIMLQDLSAHCENPTRSGFSVDPFLARCRSPPSIRIRQGTVASLW
jgi:hypothetical protein